MNTTTNPEDLALWIIPIPKWLTTPIERATDDEAGRLAMLDAMDETKAVFQ